MRDKLEAFFQFRRGITAWEKPVKCSNRTEVRLIGLKANEEAVSTEWHQPDIL